MAPARRRRGRSGEIPLSDAVIKAMNSGLLDLSEHLTAMALIDDDRDQALVMMAVLERLIEHTKALQAAVAGVAARGGADYADMGRAVGIANQSASYRWPGLTPVTLAARQARAAQNDQNQPGDQASG